MREGITEKFACNCCNEMQSSESAKAVCGTFEYSMSLAYRLTQTSPRHGSFPNTDLCKLRKLLSRKGETDKMAEREEERERRERGAISCSGSTLSTLLMMMSVRR